MTADIDKVIRNRERGYIWLERELKKNLGISTAGIAVFFLFMALFGISRNYQRFIIFLAAAILVNIIWHYLMYRREYGNYLVIFGYLESFERGGYGFCKGGAEGIRSEFQEGIRSQLTEQLDRMGRAVEEYRSRLEDEKESTKAMITDISHQLKTPVAALGLSMELMEDEQITEEEKLEFLERGKQEVQKLKYLMGTLSNLSRLETDMIRIKPKTESLKKTIIRAVNGIFIKAEEKKIRIEMDEFKDIKLPHDSRWTAEAISNVLDNAVKYSPEGTVIRLRVEPMVSYVFIEVEDEGIGIRKSEYQNVFKRFYRGDSQEVEEQEGAGVGLYLVRKILEEQGGSVCVVSAHRKGTVVRMMLPKKYEV